MKPENASNSAHSPCDQSRGLVLDLALNAETRGQLAAALLHIQSCEQCRAAMDEFDRIAQLLAAKPGTAESDSADEKWIDRALRELPAHQKRSPQWLPMSRMALAASVVFVMSLGAYWFGRHQESAKVASVISPLSAVAPIAPAELSSRVRAFEQVNRAFDNRAGWMLVSDNSSDVGLDAQPSTSRGMLLVRLTITRRNSAGDLNENRAIVSSADLAILPGRTAKLSLPFAQGRILSYEISVGSGDPTQLGLIAELLPAHGNSSDRKPLAALATTLDLQPGRSAPAGSFVTATAGYELTVGFSKAELSPESQP